MEEEEESEGEEIANAEFNEMAEAREEIEPEPEPERRICGDCGGTNLNYINPEDGGGCPSCCNGYV